MHWAFFKGKNVIEILVPILIHANIIQDYLHVDINARSALYTLADLCKF